jgi:hypothetical protein
VATFEPRRVRRRGPRIGLLVASVISAIGASAWTAAQYPAQPAPDRPFVTFEVPAQIDVAASLVKVRLVATRALTDYGLEAGARYVAVRILSHVELEVVLVAASDIVLVDSPTLCLIGPYSMPGYVGLSEPCWGKPDASRLLRARMPVDREGRIVLRGGRPVILSAALTRDIDRCDYPPGAWLLEVGAEALIDGDHTRLELGPVELTVPPDSDGPLRLVRPTHYCGIANVVFHEQGEPALAGG